MEPYFARPSQQSNNEAKRWHSLKQVFRLMAQSITSKSLSNTSWCLFLHVWTNCISIVMPVSSIGFGMSVFRLQRPPLSFCSTTLTEMLYTRWHLPSLSPLRPFSLSEITSPMFSRYKPNIQQHLKKKKPQLNDVNNFKTIFVSVSECACLICFVQDHQGIHLCVWTVT